MKLLFLVLLLPDVDPLVAQRMTNALTQPLNDHPDFIPLPDGWPKNQTDRWAAVVTAAWLCDVTDVDEFKKIWELSEHTLLFDEVMAHAHYLRFGSIQAGDVNSGPFIRPAHPIVQKLRNQRLAATQDLSTASIWEVTHQRHFAEWRNKFPAAPPSRTQQQIDRIFRDIENTYGIYHPDPVSLTLDQRYMRQQTEWWAKSRRFRRLDDQDTQRTLAVCCEWAVTNDTRQRACREVAQLLSKVFHSELTRSAKPDADDVRPMIRDIDAFMLKIFPNLKPEQLTDSVENVAIFLSRQRTASLSQWLTDLKTIAKYREILVAVRDSK
ncbi:MAG: hypothetical protein R3C49_19770 [Planctomycetaceae bacterium]